MKTESQENNKQEKEPKTKQKRKLIRKKKR